MLECLMSQLHNKLLRSVILKTFPEYAAGGTGIFVSLITGTTQRKLLKTFDFQFVYHLKSALFHVLISAAFRFGVL
jgi:hypothetical protein